MKAIFSVMILACFIILTGCYHYSNGCGYPTGCWKKYYVETPCNTYTISPCAAVCDACTFNDPACQICWTCMKNDGCLVGECRSCNGKACPLPCVSCRDVY